MTKNNVTRLLDSRHIPYTSFDLPEEKLGAIETSRKLQVPVEIVFKTIVTLREKPKKPLLIVIPGNSQVDLKAVASFLREKKIQLATQKKAEELTQLHTGGISPLALINKGFQVIIDQSALSHEWIHISGGQLGLNIRMKSVDLIKITGAKTTSASSPLSDETEE